MSVYPTLEEEIKSITVSCKDLSDLGDTMDAYVDSESERKLADRIHKEISSQISKQSGTDPMMSQKEMSKDIQNSKKELPDNHFYKPKAEVDAEEVIRRWSEECGRGLSKQEISCLVGSIVSGVVSDPVGFDSVLFGYNFRSDDNVVEASDVLQAVQEIATKRFDQLTEFEKAATRLLDGFNLMAVTALEDRALKRR